MRLWWLIVVLPVCLGFGAMQGPVHIEGGVLTCTLGHTLDTPVSAGTSAASEAREMTCSFNRAKEGSEETYSGTVRIVNASGTLPDKSTLLWAVRVPVGTQPTPGLLQQSYAVDAATPAGQVPPLVGERNAKIILQSMADKQEGSASQVKQAQPQFVIIALELLLKASTG